METAIKKSLICKDVFDIRIDENLKGHYLPQAGDVALFRVKVLGKHTRLQDDTTRNRLIFSGDLLLCAFGNRYATNQIEGYVPDQICEEYHLLGQGGVVGIVKSMYVPLQEKGPTTLELLGFATDRDGKVMNTKTPANELTRMAQQNRNRAQVILSVGSSMDSGKTTTAGYLCRGLTKAGKKAAYMKLTGTVFSKDAFFALDCGACATIDFGHFGYPSTFMCEEGELIDLFHAMMHQLEEEEPQYVVVEIADGLLQRETRALLQNPVFMECVSQLIFSAGDSLSVLSGLQLLSSWNLTPFALSGIFTSHPLLVEEVQKQVPATTILSLDDLEMPQVLDYVNAARLIDLKRFSNVA